MNNMEVHKTLKREARAGNAPEPPEMSEDNVCIEGCIGAWDRLASNEM
jgi:hypothetical protein